MRPEGRRVASGSFDGTVLTRNAISGGSVADFDDLPVFSSSFARNGGQIVTSVDGLTMAWTSETEEFKVIEMLKGSGDVAAIAAGADAYPWRLLCPESECVVELTHDGQVIVRVPESLVCIASSVGPSLDRSSRGRPPPSRARRNAAELSVESGY